MAQNSKDALFKSQVNNYISEKLSQSGTTPTFSVTEVTTGVYALSQFNGNVTLTTDGTNYIFTPQRGTPVTIAASSVTSIAVDFITLSADASLLDGKTVTGSGIVSLTPFSTLPNANLTNIQSAVLSATINTSTPTTLDSLNIGSPTIGRIINISQGEVALNNTLTMPSNTSIVVEAEATLTLTQIQAEDSTSLSGQGTINALTDTTPPAKAVTAPIMGINTDNDANGIYAAGDKIRFSFSEPINATTLTLADITLNDTHSFGEGATLTAINPSNGFTSTFEITLGASPTVVANDTLTIPASKAVDVAGNANSSEISYTVATLGLTYTSTSANDTITAGIGDDTINISGSSGADTVDGGEGTDTLNIDWSNNTSGGSYTAFSIQKADSSWVHFGERSDATAKTIANLQAAFSGAIIGYKYSFTYSPTSTTERSSVTYSNIEALNVIGKNNKDFIAYQGIGKSYQGLGGYDTFYADFSTWSEAVVWDNKASTTYSYYSDESSIVSLGGAAISGFENLLLITGSADDIITQGVTNTTSEFMLGAGNDTLNIAASNSGASQIDMGDGDDIINATAYTSSYGGTATINLGNGADILNAGSTNDTITAGIGDDTINISGSSGADIVDGGEGTDTLNIDNTSSGTYTSFSIQKTADTWVHFGKHADATAKTIANLQTAFSGAIGYKYSFNSYSSLYGYYSEITSVLYSNIEALNVIGKTSDDFMAYQEIGKSYQGLGGYDTFYADFSTWSEAVVWDNKANTSSTTYSDESNIVSLGGAAISGFENLLLITGSANDIITQGVTNTTSEFMLGAGNDTLTLTTASTSGTALIDMGEGSDTLNAGGGVDTIIINNGDSTALATDKIFYFNVTKDKLDLPSTTIATTGILTDIQDVSSNGVTVGQTTITNGIATFQAANNTTEVLIDSADALSAALGYLAGAIADAETVAFTYDLGSGNSGTYIFQGGATGDIVVDLVGVSVTGTNLSSILI